MTVRHWVGLLGFARLFHLANSRHHDFQTSFSVKIALKICLKNTVGKGGEILRLELYTLFKNSNSARKPSSVRKEVTFSEQPTVT